MRSDPSANISREFDVTAAEQLDFRLDAAVVNSLCHNPDVTGRVDDSLVAERHGVQVQGRDLDAAFYCGSAALLSTETLAKQVVVH